MLPYIELPDLQIIAANAFGEGRPAAAVAIRPFGSLVVGAVLFGVWLSILQARRRHLSLPILVDFIYFVVLGGFVGGHVFELLFYAPELLRDDPWSLIALAQGQSSFGGFLGATLGALLWRTVRKGPLMAVAEVVASSFPAAWVIGRIGCALAHDHPGIRSDLWFAVAYPAGGRLDLGLMEAVAVLPIAVTFVWLRRRPRAPGFFLGWMCLGYGPVRFLLDGLRSTDLVASDRRYSGLTPAQWGAVGILAVGLYFLTNGRMHWTDGLRRGGTAR